ncbi:hypothetical protein TNCV_2463531 [Trichonephila clavipes]|nr:hypothetical protein TNCV_2463531 [Trichonephila clavipes]
MSSNTRCSGLSRKRGYLTSRMASAFSDLNPIENVWDALGRQVAGRNYPPTNKNTLFVHSQMNGINCLNSCWIMLCKALRFRPLLLKLGLKSTTLQYQPRLPPPFRRLHERWLFSRRYVVCIPYSSVNRTIHLKRCRDNRDWSINQCAIVLFSDESRFIPTSVSSRTSI